MQLQVGVKALIRNKHDRYLFLRRKAPLSDGQIYWDIPGGRINPGEELGVALSREVLEESGLSIYGQPILVDARDIIIPSKSMHVVRLVYIVDATGDLKLSVEHAEHLWAKLDEALFLNLDEQLLLTINLIKD